MAALKLSQLPLEVLATLAARLDDGDAAQLALVSRHLCAAVRQRRTAATITVATTACVRQACAALEGWPAVTRLVLIAATDNDDDDAARSLSLPRSLRLPPTCTSIGLHGFKLARRTLDQLCAGALAGVELLALSPPPGARLNADGGLAALATLPRLRRLRLDNPAGDAGLERCVALRKLHVQLPRHLVPLTPRELSAARCLECGRLHDEEVADALAEKADAAAVRAEVGGHLPPGLQVLQVDMCGEGWGINTLFNRLALLNRDAAASGLVAPALHTLALRRVSTALAPRLLAAAAAACPALEYVDVMFEAPLCEHERAAALAAAPPAFGNVVFGSWAGFARDQSPQAAGLLPSPEARLPSPAGTLLVAKRAVPQA